jgi:GxxExxY protein
VQFGFSQQQFDVKRARTMVIEPRLHATILGTPEPRNDMDESDLLHHTITRAIIGAFFQVHRELGFGFLESVYVNALCVLLRELGFKVERQVPYEMIYHGVSIGVFRADVVVEGKVLVEAKTGRLIDPVYLARARNYLCVSKLEVGLLLNFGPSAEFKRLIATPDGPIAAKV